MRYVHALQFVVHGLFVMATANQSEIRKTYLVSVFKNLYGCMKKEDEVCVS